MTSCRHKLGEKSASLLHILYIESLYTDFSEFTEQHRAGLDARLYLRMVYSLMMLFMVLAGIALLVMLPLNLLAATVTVLHAVLHA